MKEKLAFVRSGGGSHGALRMGVLFYMEVSRRAIDKRPGLKTLFLSLEQV